MLKPIISLCMHARRSSVEEFVRENPAPVFVVESYETEDEVDSFETLAPGALGGAMGRSVAEVKKREGANAFGMMVTVGRARNNDIHIPDPQVSKFHAYVMFNGNEASITDAGSTCGTRVAGRKLAARTEKVVLNDGDEVRLGDVQLTYFSPAALHAFLQTMDD